MEFKNAALDWWAGVRERVNAAIAWTRNQGHWASCIVRARFDFDKARQIERFEKVTGFKW